MTGRLGKFALVILLGPILGTIIHEAGHLLVFSLTNTSVLSIVIFGKLQLYPSLSIVENVGGGFMIFTVFPDHFTRGVGSLGGVAATLPVSMAGLALYMRKRTLPRLVFACYLLDALSYLLIPSLGLRRWIIFGAPYSEVLVGLDLLGVPRGGVILLVVGYSLGHFGWIIRSFRRDRRPSERR